MLYFSSNSYVCGNKCFQDADAPAYTRQINCRGEHSTDIDNLLGSRIRTSHLDPFFFPLENELGNHL